MARMWVRPLVICGLWLLAAGGLMLGGRAINLIADDAYYYFEIARNAAIGQGFTFDSLAPTNGFHPLWAWLLVPVFRIFPAGEWLPIHIALGLSLVCMAWTALLIFRLFARHGSPLAGEIATYAWLFNPFSISLVFRGMEGPLNVLVLMTSISMLDTVRGRGRYGVRELVGLGITVGLAFLARSDNLLWLGSVGVVLAWDLQPKFGLRRAASGLACFGATVLVVTSPWLIWNLVTFGTVVQSGVDAKRIFQLYGELPPIAPGGIHGIGALGSALFGAGRNLFIVAQSAFRYAAAEEWTPPNMAYRLMAVAGVYGLAVAICALVFRRRPAPAAAGLRALGRNIAAPIALFFVAHFLVYTFAIGSYSNWYSLPPVLVVCIGVGLGMGWVSALGPGWRRMVVLAHVVLLAAMTFAFGRGHFLPRRAERDRLLLLGHALPVGTRIGLWNAGQVGYFFSFHFPNSPVINLDGVVNNELIRRARAGQYEPYVLEHVDVVIEPPSKFGTVLDRERAKAFVARHVRPRGMAGGRAVSDLE